jgi:hypothetical protein
MRNRETLGDAMPFKRPSTQDAKNQPDSLSCGCGGCSSCGGSCGCGECGCGPREPESVPTVDEKKE